jgi:hypothetical protein
MATTIYRISEEILRLIAGGNSDVASKVHIREIMISVGQTANALLKTEYLQVNVPMQETIPNGAMLGLYERIEVTQWLTKSKCKLPIKPIKLPRNMGVFSVFSPLDPDCEYIPLEMGQSSLLQSQPLINDLLGQIGYTTYGDEIVFTKDLTLPNTPVYVSMRLVILDITLYGDWDILPILPEQEFQIKKEVVAMYLGEPVADKVVDPGRAEQKGVPLKQQSQ